MKDDCVVDCMRLGLLTYMRESAAAYVARSDGAANPETSRTPDRPEPGRQVKEEPEPVGLPGAR